MENAAIENGMPDSLLFYNWSTIIFNHLKACDVKWEKDENTKELNEKLLGVMIINDCQLMNNVILECHEIMWRCEILNFKLPDSN